MSEKILDLTVEENIGTITISRPEAMNALNSQFFSELGQMLETITGDQSVRVVIITGTGKAFVAGADIAEMVNLNSAQGSEFAARGQAIFDRLENLPVPTIAAVNGFALGGGCELAMACDMRIASTKAKFGQPEVNLGVTPGFAGTQRLPHLAGLGNALYMLCSGEMINAETAFTMGLVQKTTEPEELMSEVNKLARTIAQKGPKSVQLVKRLARQSQQMNFADGCATEARDFGSLFGDEATEGMTAFLEKRSPRW